jgi:hypothetical protein
MHCANCSAPQLQTVYSAVQACFCSLFTYERPPFTSRSERTAASSIMSASVMFVHATSTDLSTTALRNAGSIAAVSLSKKAKHRFSSCSLSVAVHKCAAVQYT